MRDVGFVFILLLITGLNLDAQSKMVLHTTVASNELNNELTLDRAKKSGRTIPFDLVGGLIFLKAEMEGQTSNFILDTGAPTVILNGGEQVHQDADSYATGINGTIAIQTKQLRSFRLGAIEKFALKVMMTDFTRLEAVTEQDIEGLIGQEVIRHEEILLDYDQQEFHILPKRHRKSYQDLEVVEELKFKLWEHLVVIKAEIDGKTYHFGIDSGAEINLLDENLKAKINPAVLSKESNLSLYGIEQQGKAATAAFVDTLKIKDVKLEDMEFVFTDISHINAHYNLELDGILGYPFLSAAIFSIDFRKKRLRVWERETIAEAKTDH